MKLMTKNTDYAVRAVLNLTRNKDGFISSKDIAKDEGIPLYYLRRILQVLIKKGVLVAKEGVGGGVKLNTDPGEIHMIDLIRYFQGDIQLTDCMFKDKICVNRNTCVLKSKIKKIEDKVIEEFRKITINDLLKDLGGAG